jgi:hypothetical protein
MGGVLDSLLSEATRMLAEVRDERDRAKREAADLRAALKAEQVLTGELHEALYRLAELTPARANAGDAQDLHLTVKAIAETAIAKVAGQ